MSRTGTEIMGGVAAPAAATLPRLGRLTCWPSSRAAGIALAVSVALLTGCGGQAITSVRGTLSVTDFGNSGSGCVFANSYSDISQGAQVVVKSPSGSIIGTGRLGAPVSKMDSVICVFPFTVRGVPAEPRYGISVSGRGTIWVGASQAGQVSLSL